MNSNPWLQIPLEDYEKHMSHELVGQSALLNTLTKKYLDLINPECVIFLGIAGGNGLEHIDISITQQVYGIDINQDYLHAALKRYNHKIPSLQLLNMDITRNTETICSADFIWAALVLEYTGVENTLSFCTKNICKDGHLVISIQSNNNKTSVSSTGVDSVKKAGEIFSAIDPAELISTAAKKGYGLRNKEENFLPNGKSIVTFHLIAESVPEV
jgi:hypothetical protein